MPNSTPLVLCLALLAGACASTVPEEPREPEAPESPPIVEADPARRGSLFGAVAELEGRWELVDDGGMSGIIEYAVTAGGHSVREVMFPGAPHEMVNMYSLDGNSLVMTHYCAAGNQPRMRAVSFDGRNLPFGADGVSDLKSADEEYMGSMVLEIVSPDRIIQHWTSLQNGELGNTNDMELVRID